MGTKINQMQAELLLRRCGRRAGSLAVQQLPLPPFFTPPPATERITSSQVGGRLPAVEQTELRPDWDGWVGGCLRAFLPAAD